MEPFQCVWHFEWDNVFHALFRPPFRIEDTDRGMKEPAGLFASGALTFSWPCLCCFQLRPQWAVPRDSESTHTAGTWPVCVEDGTSVTFLAAGLEFLQGTCQACSCSSLPACHPWAGLSALTQESTGSRGPSKGTFPKEACWVSCRPHVS